MICLQETTSDYQWCQKHCRAQGADFPWRAPWGIIPRTIYCGNCRKEAKLCFIEVKSWYTSFTFYFYVRNKYIRIYWPKCGHFLPPLLPLGHLPPLLPSSDIVGDYPTETAEVGSHLIFQLVSSTSLHLNFFCKSIEA